jgi:hypothetical protein
VSVAYWFLVPSYLAMWLGGGVLAKVHERHAVGALAWLLPVFMLSTTACYLVSNGSFYWLSDVVAAPTLAGWAKNLGDWYLPYLRTAGMYVAGAAVLHVVVALIARELPSAKRALVD